MIPFLFYLYIFIFGCVIGSFLNVVIYRVPINSASARAIPFVLPAIIGYFQKILFLCSHGSSWRGKCAYCGAPIAARYPFVELLGGFAFLLSFNR